MTQRLTSGTEQKGPRMTTTTTVPGTPKLDVGSLENASAFVAAAGLVLDEIGEFQELAEPDHLVSDRHLTHEEPQCGRREANPAGHQMPPSDTPPPPFPGAALHVLLV